MNHGLARAFLIIAFALAFVGCDNVRISVSPGQLASTMAKENIGEFCAAPPAVTTPTEKIVFLVDKSGSNCGQDLSASCNSSGSDPDGHYRQGIIQNFAAAYPKISYAIITFGGTAAQTALSFTNDPSAITAAITQLPATADVGLTPYKAAFTAAKNLILGDVSASKGGANYYIVLMSDGIPTDYGDPIDTTSLANDVRSLVAGSGKITLSTVYYNPMNITQDDALLSSIASAGHGGHINVNASGSTANLGATLGMSTSVPWVITDMIVDNLTSAPCDDGTIGPDSDADGLCDADELAYNRQLPNSANAGARMGGKLFDPQNRNSFGAAYGDLFYYRYFAYGESPDLNCSLVGSLAIDDADGDLLNTCEEAMLSSVTPSGPNANWTAAMGNRADPNNFDSDGDGLLDSLELRFKRQPSSVLDYNTSQAAVGSDKVATLIRQHRNLNSPNSSPAYDGRLKFSRVNPLGQNCYTFDQSVLPLYHTLPVTAVQVSGYSQLAHAADENVIMIYYIQKPSNALDSPGIFFSAFQKLKYSDAGANLSAGQLQFSPFIPSRALVNQSY